MLTDEERKEAWKVYDAARLRGLQIPRVIASLLRHIAELEKQPDPPRQEPEPRICPNCSMPLCSHNLGWLSDEKIAEIDRRDAELEKARQGPASEGMPVCPWCKEPVRYVPEEDSAITGSGRVRCDNDSCPVQPESAEIVGEAEAIAAWNAKPTEPAPMPFTKERRIEVNNKELRGGEIPPKDAQTPEELAHHVEAMVCSFWGHPGERRSKAELVYTVALGALRRMAELRTASAPMPPFDYEGWPIDKGAWDLIRDLPIKLKELDPEMPFPFLWMLPNGQMFATRRDGCTVENSSRPRVWPHRPHIGLLPEWRWETSFDYVHESKFSNLEFASGAVVGFNAARELKPAAAEESEPQEPAD